MTGLRLLMIITLAFAAGALVCKLTSEIDSSASQKPAACFVQGTAITSEQCKDKP